MRICRSAVFGAWMAFAVSVCALASEGPLIAFTSRRAGGWDIYVANLEDDATQRLTTHPAADWYASWSPDGTRVAFASNRDGDYAVYLMESDGRNARRVEAIEGWAAYPAWSPDGKSLAYVSGEGGLYTVALATGETRLLTNRVTWSRPAWSPDGRVVAFRSWDEEGGHWDVFAVDADGANRRNITDSMWGDQDPTWSPGGQIAFSSWRKPGRAIHVMDADGANVHAVTDDTVSTNRHVRPDWSADGRWIAYDSRTDVYVLDMNDGKSQVVVGGGLGDRNEEPSIWTPSALSVSPVGRRSVAWGWLKAIGVGAAR